MKVLEKDLAEVSVCDLIKVTKDIDFMFAFPMTKKKGRDAGLVDVVQRCQGRRMESGGRVCGGHYSNDLGESSGGDLGVSYGDFSVGGRGDFGSISLSTSGVAREGQAVTARAGEAESGTPSM